MPEKTGGGRPSDRRRRAPPPDLSDRRRPGSGDGSTAVPSFFFFCCSLASAVGATTKNDPLWQPLLTQRVSVERVPSRAKRRGPASTMVYPRKTRQDPLQSRIGSLDNSKVIGRECSQLSNGSDCNKSRQSVSKSFSRSVSWASRAGWRLAIPIAPVRVTRRACLEYACLVPLAKGRGSERRRERALRVASGE